MIAYNREWIASLRVDREAKRWLESKLIFHDQYLAIKSAGTTPLYTPNFFIRIALFIFAYLCCQSIIGMIMLGAGVTGYESNRIIGISLGTIAIIVLELLIMQKNLFRAGIDDALLYVGLTQLLVGVFVTFIVPQELSQFVLVWIIFLPFFLAAVVRYGDSVASLGLFICCYGIILTPLFQGSRAAQTFIPFAMLATAFPIYVCSRYLQKYDILAPWEYPLTVFEVLSLCVFYLGGNYYVVRTLQESLMGIQVVPGKDIPFAFFFYLFTAIVPIVYLIHALLSRNHILLRVGLLALGFSAFTFKYYFSLGHPEIILTFGGAVLFLSSLMAIRYLKTPRNGITQEQLLKSATEGLDLEGVIFSQAVGQPTTADKGLKGGGGEFGGGGSTSQW